MNPNTFEHSYEKALLSSLNTQILSKLSEAAGQTAQLQATGSTSVIEFPNLFRLAFKQFLWDLVASGEHTTYLKSGTEKFYAPFNSMSEIANFMGKCGLVFSNKTNMDGNEVHAFLCSLGDVYMSFTSEDYERYNNFYKKAKLNPVYVSCAVISGAPTRDKSVTGNGGHQKKKAKAENLAVVKVIVLDEIYCTAYLDGKKQRLSFYKVLVPNSLSSLVPVYGDVARDVRVHGDVGYLPSKWVAFMRSLNPSLNFCVEKEQHFGKLSVVLNVLTSVNNVMSWDVSRFVVAEQTPQHQSATGMAQPQYGPEMPPFTAPPGFKIVEDLSTVLDANSVSEGILKGCFIAFKFDAPAGWQLCQIIKALKNDTTFNYMLHTCSDLEQIYVALKLDNYSFALQAQSSSWCLVRRLVPAPAEFSIVESAIPTASSIDQGYLLGRKVMFHFSTGWTSAAVTRFNQKNKSLPYEMLCDDDGAKIRVLFQISKYSAFLDSEFGSWCLLSENLPVKSN